MGTDLITTDDKIFFFKCISCTASCCITCTAHFFTRAHNVPRNVSLNSKSRSGILGWHAIRHCRDDSNQMIHNGSLLHDISTTHILWPSSEYNKANLMDTIRNQQFKLQEVDNACIVACNNIMFYRMTQYIYIFKEITYTVVKHDSIILCPC